MVPSPNREQSVAVTQMSVLWSRIGLLLSKKTNKLVPILPDVSWHKVLRSWISQHTTNQTVTWREKTTNNLWNLISSTNKKVKLLSSPRSIASTVRWEIKKDRWTLCLTIDFLTRTTRRIPTVTANYHATRVLVLSGWTRAREASTSPVVQLVHEL